MTLEELQAQAEAAPNTRIVHVLPGEGRLGVTRLVRKAYGRVSKAYAGFEEFSWLYEIWTRRANYEDQPWPHIKDEARGWRVIMPGAWGEDEARALLAGKRWRDVVRARMPLQPIGGA
jgi:hypothetical protein